MYISTNGKNIFIGLLSIILILFGSQALKANAQGNIDYSNVQLAESMPSISVSKRGPNIKINLIGFLNYVEIRVFNKDGTQVYEDLNYQIDESDPSIVVETIMEEGVTIEVIDKATQAKKTLTIPSFYFSWVDIEAGVVNIVGPEYGQVWLLNNTTDQTYNPEYNGSGLWIIDFDVPINLSDNWTYGIIDEDGDEVTGGIGAPRFNANLTFNYIEFGFVTQVEHTIYIDWDGIDYTNDYLFKKTIQSSYKLPFFEYQLGDFILEPGMVVTLECCGMSTSIEVVDIQIDAIDLANRIVSGTSTVSDGEYLDVWAANDNDWSNGALRHALVDNGYWRADYSDEENFTFSENIGIAAHWFKNENVVEVDKWANPLPEPSISFNLNGSVDFHDFSPYGSIKLTVWDSKLENNLYGDIPIADQYGDKQYSFPQDTWWDLVNGNWIWATDNSTGNTVAYQIAEVVIESYTSLDHITLMGWPNDDPVTLEVRSGSFDGELLHTMQATPQPSPEYFPYVVDFYLWQDNFDLLPSHYLIISDGTTTKEIPGIEFTYDGLNLDNGNGNVIISGTVSPDMEVGLEFLHYSEIGIFGSEGIIYENGTWTGSFDVPTDLPPETWGTADVVLSDLNTLIQIHSPNIQFGDPRISQPNLSGKTEFHDFSPSEEIKLYLYDSQLINKLFEPPPPPLMTDGTGYAQYIFPESTWWDLVNGNWILVSDTSTGSTAAYRIADYVIESYTSLDHLKLMGWLNDDPVTLEIRSGTFEGEFLHTMEATPQTSSEYFPYVVDFYLDYDLLPSHYLTISDGKTIKEIPGIEFTYDVLDLDNGIISGTVSNGLDVGLEFLYYPVPVFVNDGIIYENGTWTQTFDVPIDPPLPPETWGTAEIWLNGLNTGIFVHTPNVIGSNSATLQDETGQTTIFVPSEALAEPTRLTTWDMGTNFTLTTDLGGATAVYGVEIGPSGTQFNNPITVTMSWEDEDNDGYVDGTGDPGIWENDLFISKDGVAFTPVCSATNNTDPLSLDNPHCYTIENTFSVQVESLSEFVLATFTNPIIGSISVEQDLVPVSQTISASATFDGEIDSSISASWDWGDGSTSPATIENNNVPGSHAYLIPGVYTIRLNLSNEHAGSYTNLYQYIVVYDPNGGFVTGGGWIDSPNGAYVPDPTLTGKATFGFVSKYKKGATVPTGNTEFQFKAGDLNFHSSDYQWLVVTGSDYARFKGTGTINGEGEYKFMIWAGDSIDEGADTFRIRIWEEDEFGNETDVYDNGFDQAIGGGNIVVHTGK